MMLWICVFASSPQISERLSDAGEEAWAAAGREEEDALGIVPILLVKLQHHVVGGHAQWAAALVVLLLVL